MTCVIVETLEGFEVWPDFAGSSITAVFTERADAEKFVSCTAMWTEDRIRNVAFNVASAFPDLNYSGKPINPNGELVLKIMRLIRADFPAATPVAATGADEEKHLLMDDDAALVSHAINVAREVQEFIWADCYPALRPYDAEGWRRLFQKRVDCIAEVNLTGHGGLAALRKRLLQQAALSIKALALVNRWAKHNPSPSLDGADLRDTATFRTPVEGESK